MSDTVPGDISTTYSLTIGGSLGGQIDPWGDADWYAVNLTAGRIYSFALRGEASGGGSLTLPRLGIHDASGNDLANAWGNYTSDPTLLYSPLSTGAYYVSARGYDTGTFILSGAEVGLDDHLGGTATTSALTPLIPASGNIQFAGDEDWFRVELDADVFYAFDLKGVSSGAGTLAVPWLELRDATGAILLSAGGTGLDVQLNHVTSAAGQYYLSAAAGYGSGGGSYALSVTSLGTDDYAADASTTGVLIPGGSVTGGIQTGFDLDWFSVELTAGRIYRFDLRGVDSGGGSLADPWISLVSPDNLTTYVIADEDSGTGRDAQILFSSNTSSRMYLTVADPYTGSTGSYTLMATDLGADDYLGSALTSGMLVAGASATGNIQFLGDIDWIGIELGAGRIYQFDIRGVDSGGGSLAEPFLALVDSAGVTVGVDFDGGTDRDAQLQYSPGTDGIYYLSVGDRNSTATGTYTASVTDLGADDFLGNTLTTDSLAPGGLINGNIQFIGDNDWLRIELTAGHIYQLDATGVDSGGGSLGDPALALYDSSGNYRFVGGDSGMGRDAQLRFRADASGTFHAAVHGSGGTGTYTLRLLDFGPDDYPGNTSTTAIVPIGGTAQGEIQFAGDQDWFRVDLTAGRIFSFDLLGAGSGGGSIDNPYFRLLDGTGALLASNDSYNGTARITWFANATGTHYLAAEAWSGSGSYTLAVSDLGPDDHAGSVATTSQLAVGGSANGNIQFTSDQDWFRIDLTAGQTCIFHMLGAESGGGDNTDPYLRLLNAAGQELAAGYDSSYRDDASIVYTASTTAAYYLSAQGGFFGSPLGSYTLSASQDDYAGGTVTTAAGPTPGGAVTGSVQYVGDQDWLRVELRAGEIYAFRLEGEHSGTRTLNAPELRLMDDAGRLLQLSFGNAGTAATLGYIPTTSGTYYLVATGEYGSTGGYRLSSLADDYPDGIGTTGNLATGVPVTGNILFTQDKDWLRISLTSGTSYTFSLEGLDSGAGTLADPLLRLHDAAGNTLISNSDGGIGKDAAISFIPSSTGTYYLSAETQYGGGGSYTLLAKSLGSSYQATPVANAMALTGDPLLDGLIQGSKWNFTGSRVLTYSFNDIDDENGSLFGGPWTDEDKDAVRGALSAWAAVANLNFVEIPGSTTIEENTANLAFGHTGNLLTSFFSASGLGFFPDPNYVNLFLTELESNRVEYPRAEGDVLLDDYSGPMQFLGLGDAGHWVGLHELGHALGLKHPFDDGLNGRPTFDALGIGDRDVTSQTAMSYNTPESSLTEGYPAGPMPLDILAIQHIYGVNSNYHSEDNTYYFTWINGLQTIWDTGGNDWLDASLLDAVSSAGLDLNLAPGSINSVDSLGAVLAIAYNVSIENARGGSGPDTLRGTDAANILEGMAGADMLLGAGGDDSLNGGGDSDLLDGGPGVDNLAGGDGNDIYFVDNRGDMVIEHSGALAGEWDTVISRVTYDLSANVENLVLNASTPSRGLFSGLMGGRPRDIGVHGGGNDGDNLLVGNRAGNRLAGGAGDDRIGAGAGDDLLIGGAGSDLLIGDRGRDTFLLDSLVGIDRIADFAAEDRLWFDHAVFSGLDLGALAQTAFVSGAGLTAARDADDRIIHDTSSGALYYDSDGLGGSAALQVAVLLTHAYGRNENLGHLDYAQVWVI